jgi:hypothetical protein
MTITDFSLSRTLLADFPGVSLRGVMLTAHLVWVPFDPGHQLFQDCHNPKCWQFFRDRYPHRRSYCGSELESHPMPEQWFTLPTLLCSQCLNTEAEINQVAGGRQQSILYYIHELVTTTPERSQP